MRIRWFYFFFRFFSRTISSKYVQPPLPNPTFEIDGKPHATRSKYVPPHLRQLNLTFNANDGDNNDPPNPTYRLDLMIRIKHGAIMTF